MALSSYSELKDAVRQYLGREDLDELIPTFIRLAENRMDRDLRLRVMENRAKCQVKAGAGQVPLPWRRIDGDWDVFLEMRDLTWLPDGENRGVNLYYTAPDTYAVERGSTGRPTHYTIIGKDLFLLPTPSEGGTLYLSYWREIPPLSSRQKENEVLLTAPDLYLYAALVESAPYTRGSAPVDLWSTYYAAAKERVKNTEQHARFTANLFMRPQRRV